MTDARRARPEVNALVADLLARLQQSDVCDLEVRRNGIRVRVSRSAAASVTPQPEAVVAVRRSARAEDAAAPAPAPALVDPALQITAPLTGIFYRAPSPQAPPFVQVGGAVGEGDVVALIEAMKLFNEIRSTKSGIVRKVLVETGQLVKAHQPLFELDPL